MGMSVAERQDQIERACEDLELDLKSQLFTSKDPIIADELMPRLDLSEEIDVAGVTRRLFPIVLSASPSAALINCLDPHTEIEWHCHRHIEVHHLVCSGHVILERLARDGDGNPIRKDDGSYKRETIQLDACSWWYAPRGIPYAYRTKNDRACVTYRHIESDDGPRDCVDDSAAIKD